MKTNLRYTKLFRHGGLAVGITVIVIALVIVLNAVVSSLAKANMWYIDMTEEKLFTLSDATKEIISTVDYDVDIIFAKEEDAIMDRNTSNTYLKYVLQTAKQLDKEFPNIHVECVDIIKNPGYFEELYKTENLKGTTILTTDVLVKGPAELPRKLSVDAFFVWDENRQYIWGYNGEAKFASTILQVTSSEAPSVCFTSGHGETSPDETPAFKALCETAGFEVRQIDLSKEDITDDVRILVINNPIFDFAGIEATEIGNEIDKISDFLNSYGTVFVFLDSERSANLVNLNEFLAEWGLEFCSGQIVKDLENSISYDGREIVAEYESANTLGASLYNSISEHSSMPKTILPNAMPINMLYDTDSALFKTYEASPVLYSHSSARVIENGSESPAGRKTLMSITRKEGIRDNDYVYAYLVASGSPSMISDKYLNSNAYANSDILFNTIRLTGREKAVANIDLKVFDNTEFPVTASQAKWWTVGFAVILPALIGVAGIIICYRRRKR